MANKSDMANKAKTYDKVGTIEGIFAVIMMIASAVFFILYAFTAVWSLAVLSLALLILTVGAYLGMRHDQTLTELYRMH